MSQFNLQADVTDIDISDDSEFIIAGTSTGAVY